MLHEYFGMGQLCLFLVQYCVCVLVLEYILLIMKAAIWEMGRQNVYPTHYNCYI